MVSSRRSDSDKSHWINFVEALLHSIAHSINQISLKFCISMVQHKNHLMMTKCMLSRQECRSEASSTILAAVLGLFMACIGVPKRGFM